MAETTSCRGCGEPFPAERDFVYCDRCGTVRRSQRAAVAASNHARARPGARSTDRAGYVRVSMGDGTWAYEHRLVAEAALGRPLTSDEAVHHRNAIRTDNRPANLAVMARGAHTALHNHLAPKRRKSPETR